MPEIAQSFVVAFPRDVVWRELHDFAMVAGAMPGVSLDPGSLETQPPGTHLSGTLALKLGPIITNFAGTADVEMDDATFTGTVRGQALDRKNNSRARSETRFSLAEENLATRLDIKLDFTLSGPLAQFGRGSIVQEVAQRLTKEFAHNLENAIAVRLAAAPGPAAAAPESAAPIGLLGILWSAFVSWLRRLFAGGRDLHA